MYRRELQCTGFGGNEVVNRIASPRTEFSLSLILCHHGHSCMALAKTKTPGSGTPPLRPMRTEANLEADFPHQRTWYLASLMVTY